MRILITFYVALFMWNQISAQTVSVSIGSDIPYQHYLGINLDLENIDTYYRSGVLVSPYSGVILGILEGFGTDEIYIDLLESAYEFGWMNSLGVKYKFGRTKSWYVGTEFRLDLLTASDTPQNVIEAVSGQTISRPDIINRNIDLQLGLRTLATGIRLGKIFTLGSEKRHSISTEISFSKFIASHSVLKGNVSDLSRINQEIDRLLWEDVFRKYGYIGGIGIAYSYKL